jgi:hypothetical protein
MMYAPVLLTGISACTAMASSEAEFPCSMIWRRYFFQHTSGLENRMKMNASRNGGSRIENERINASYGFAVMSFLT